MLFADLGMPTCVLTRADLSAFQMPALVVTGTRSHPALSETARALAAGLPHARLQELDCGHVTYAEQPEMFAQAVASLVDELSPRLGPQAN